MNFSAVILAGGKSSRMGRDKAWLEVDGEPLLARQIQLVRATGAREILISGRADGDYAPFGCPVVRDEWPGAGPLGGLAAALEAALAPLLLVLAVDMPHMTEDCLRRLFGECTETTGAIPRVNGQIEPLAAFYPKTARDLLPEFSAANPPASPAVLGARPFAGRCVASGRAVWVDMAPILAGCFANWNSPADLCLPV
jgi:molybdopterin-guanine dinucleotide biosynthesis protein A